jgi:hypothetical protein
MTTSTAGSRSSLGAWLFLALGTYLVLEIGAFFVLGLALRKTAADLAGSYLACAMPAAIFMPLVWWLRQREKQSASPKLLAREWGASVAFFGVAMVAAVIYSGVRLSLMDSKDAVGGLVVSVLLCVPISYFTVQHMAITHISSRAAAKGISPKSLSRIGAC